MKRIDNDSYALKAEKNETSRQYKSLGRSILEIETGLETILKIFNIGPEELKEDPMVRIGLETNLETIQVIDQMIEQERLEKFLDRNPANIVNIVIRMATP